MAGEIDDEGLPNFRRYPVGFEKLHDIEEVAGVLTIQCRHELATVQIGVGNKRQAQIGHKGVACTRP